jgi:drug/metabolite transporter (DMT)-like permease
MGLILALSSAIGFAIYLLIAKILLAKYGLWRYFGLVNLSSAITLLAWLLIKNKINIILDIELWLWGALLALIPGIFGHAIYNWSMSKLHQIDVAIATLGEPVLGTIMAWIIFTEILSPLQSVGLSFLLLAIIISFWSRKKNK